MKLTEARYTETQFQGETLRVKHMTTREYLTFAGTEDKNVALAYLVKTSLGVSDEEYDNIPMSALTLLPAVILEANGLDAKTEDAEGNG